MKDLTAVSSGLQLRMVEIRKSEEYAKWIDGLRDLKARARIQARVERLRAGNPGDVKPIGAGVSEMRIDYGPSYRVYFVKRGDVLIILLVGGDKGSQTEDIKTALTLASKLRRIKNDHNITIRRSRTSSYT
jgi:putative addiction module killer protein